MDRQVIDSIAKKIESELNIKTYVDTDTPTGALPKWTAVKRCDFCTMQIREDDVAFTTKGGVSVCNLCYEHIGFSLITPPDGIRLRVLVFGVRAWTPFVIDPNKKRRNSKARK